MSVLEKGTDFIWHYARSLERAIFEYRFLGGDAGRILAILKTYQNADGGFGHALEPDVRAPDSQPLFVEFALSTLRECNLRDEEVACRACNFLEAHADLAHGIPTLLPSAGRYPRAAHWISSTGDPPSFDRLVGLVGLANWQRVRHTWLDEATEICLKRMGETNFTDAHTILMAFSLLESLADAAPQDLFDGLADQLPSARFYCSDAPVTGYGLTPLAFAPSPDSYCHQLFSGAQLDSHLDDLLSAQLSDGGWPIHWDPPGDMATWEWRAQGTLNALSTLRAYGRI